MNDRVMVAQQEKVTEFIQSVGRALAGGAGDSENVCQMFTDKHDRHTAQAVLILIQRINVIRQQAAHTEMVAMRRESGFPG